MQLTLVKILYFTYNNNVYIVQIAYIWNEKNILNKNSVDVGVPGLEPGTAEV